MPGTNEGRDEVDLIENEAARDRRSGRATTRTNASTKSDDRSGPAASRADHLLERAGGYTGNFGYDRGREGRQPNLQEKLMNVCAK